MMKHRSPIALGFSLLLLLVLSFPRLHAQTVALRTNTLLWATEAANLGIDLTINDYSTLGLSGVWSLHDSWIHHTNVKGLQLEYRYWFTHQPLHSLFVGPVAGLMHYRIDDDPHTQYTVPAGIQMGYAWSLSRHWNIEALYGVGYLFYTRASSSTYIGPLYPRDPAPVPEVSPSGSVVTVPEASPSVSVATVPEASPSGSSGTSHKFTTINLGLSISYVF